MDSDIEVWEASITRLFNAYLISRHHTQPISLIVSCWHGVSRAWCGLHEFVSKAGFEPTTSVTPIRCSTHWATTTHVELCRLFRFWMGNLSFVEGGHGDLRCCGVDGFFDAAMRWIKSQFAVLRWSQTQRCAMFVFRKLRCSVKWNYLRCCGFFFDLSKYSRDQRNWTPKFIDVTILVTKRTLHTLEMLFYRLAAFRVNFSVMFMELHTNDLSG